ncbi:hypothetical protein PG995_000820 [Apiospora arundinis]
MFRVPAAALQPSCGRASRLAPRACMPLPGMRYGYTRGKITLLVESGIISDLLHGSWLRTTARCKLGSSLRSCQTVDPLVPSAYARHGTRELTTRCVLRTEPHGFNPMRPYASRLWAMGYGAFHGNYFSHVVNYMPG